MPKRLLNTDDEQLPWWLRKVNFKLLLIFFAFCVVFFFTLKLYYYSFHLQLSLSESFHLSLDDIVDHMDLFGYIIGAIGIYIGFYIAKEVEIKNDKKNKELQEKIDKLDLIESQISESVKDLVDATRNIIETFPDILDESIRIVNQITKPNDRLLVMNYTSKFGLIHSFNMRFINQIKESHNSHYILDSDSLKKEWFLRKLNVFRAKIEKLDMTIYEASRIGEFCLITFDELMFKAEFIQPYFAAENEPEERNLFYYPYEGKDLNTADLEIISETNRATIIEKIAAKVMEHHKKAFDQLCIYRPECISKKKKIPYQMILAEYFSDDQKEIQHESLIIYAVDESNGPNKKKRNLIGISSKNRQMFKAFETMFNDVKTLNL